MDEVHEILSFAPVIFGSGLLGATSPTAEGVEQARLLEIERRILAIEAKLEENDDEILQSGIG